MRDPDSREDVEPRRATNWTLVLLLGGVLVVLLLVIYLASRGNADQDKLTNSAAVTTSTTVTSAAHREKLCASSATYDLLKRELFRRAAQLRGNDQAGFDKVAAIAVARMENPVMESQDPTTGAVSCSGSLSLDLPPGIAVVGGRHTLTSDVDYTITSAADGSGPVVLLKNADAIVAPLATIGQVNAPTAAPAQQPADTNAVAPEANTPASPPPPQPSPSPQPAVPARPAQARPSFDCSTARTRGEVAVCNNAGLAALDRQMAAQYRRAFDVASPEERDILKESAHRFYGYRDHCSTNACIGDAYVGRMREIRDIMEGRWRPTQ